MTLEEAKNKILSEGHLESIHCICDYGDFWVFGFPPNAEIIGKPPAIIKKTGELFYFFAPDHFGENYTVVSK